MLSSNTKPYVNTRESQSELINVIKPVRVYRNLHRDCWSVKQGVVRFHCDIILLADVTFPVNEKVRQRVAETKRKEVHAYVMGYMPIGNFPTKIESSQEIYYNPYTCKKFMCDGKEIESCGWCVMAKVKGVLKVFKCQMAGDTKGIRIPCI